MKRTVVVGLALLLVLGAAGAYQLRSPQPARTSVLPFQPEGRTFISATQPTASLGLHTPAATPTANTGGLLCGNLTASAEHFSCLKNHYQNLVTSRGVDAAFDDLKKRYATDPFVVTQCHPLTHVIGREAASLYPKVAEAYLHGDSFCWSGYHHGILEGVVKRIGQENLPKEMDGICADLPGREIYSFDYYNCVHGLGHGVMELNGDDVFTSLTQCDNLSGAWEKQSCYSGVFMENVIVFERDGSAPFLKPKDPLYPCTAVAEPYKYQCYLGQTSFILNQNGGNFAKTFDVCARIEPGFRDICNQSIGRDAANYAGHHGPRTKATCDLAPVEHDAVQCTVGAVKEIISYYHRLTEANAYCDLLSETQKEVCLATGKEYFKLF